MQHLQWFPGHMTAAFRMMEENVKLVDGVIIVLDSRAVKASVNPKLDKLFDNKKVLYVLNKSDLADQEGLKRAMEWLKNSNREYIAISAFDKKGVSALYNRIFFIMKEKLAINKQKGVFKPVRIMVAGIPNTGKSTIINSLVGGKKAITGNKAGVTKGKQWVRLNELELLDTPGTMPPAFENQAYAKQLAYLGSMNDANIDFLELSQELLKELAKKHQKLLTEKYNIENFDITPLEMLNAVCVRRGFLLKGGEYDYSRCAVALIDDLRKGRIGKISFD